jgi:putative nucleotidyltransferase with HDIG domain
MKKKLDIGDLAVGMFVSELDRPWIETPFLFQGFRITNEAELNKLIELCKFVVVDIEKSKVPITKGSVMASEPNMELNLKRKPKPYVKTFEEEYEYAKTVYKDSQSRVNRFFADTRLGKNIAMTGVSTSVTPLVDSIFRNPNTLTLFSNIKASNENLETHSINCCILSLTFARHLGFDKTKMYELGVAALLHDIGETQIPDNILNKRGNPTKEEQDILHNHCNIGATMLSKVNGIPHSAISVAQHHHERSNESGYPSKLSGEDIGLFSKIIAVIDMYDTLTTGLSNQPPITCSDALKHMYEWRNDLFDATIVEQFIQCLGIYPIGSAVQLSTGETGIVITVPEKNRLSPSVMLIKNSKNQTFLPPRIVNIAMINEAAVNAEDEDGEHTESLEITKVIDPKSFDMDLKNFVLRELTVAQPA